MKIRRFNESHVGDILSNLLPLISDEGVNYRLSKMGADIHGDHAKILGIDRNEYTRIKIRLKSVHGEYDDSHRPMVEEFLERLSAHYDYILGATNISIDKLDDDLKDRLRGIRGIYMNPYNVSGQIILLNNLEEFYKHEGMSLIIELMPVIRSRKRWSYRVDRDKVTAIVPSGTNDNGDLSPVGGVDWGDIVANQIVAGRDITGIDIKKEDGFSIYTFNYDNI